MEEPKLNELVESIHRQRELAKDALSEAKKIDNLLQDPALDPKAKKALEEAKEGLLKVTRGLVANTNASTTVVSSTMSFIDQLARHGRN
jgi:hypothetical protein